MDWTWRARLRIVRRARLPIVRGTSGLDLAGPLAEVREVARRHAEGQRRAVRRARALHVGLDVGEGRELLAARRPERDDDLGGGAAHFLAGRPVGLDAPAGRRDYGPSQLRHLAQPLQLQLPTAPRVRVKHNSTELKADSAEIVQGQSREVLKDC